jgi:23S rRNA G2445 N2-methylase RlmL
MEELTALGAVAVRAKQHGIAFSCRAAGLTALLARLRCVEQVIVQVATLDLYGNEALPRLFQALRKAGWLAPHAAVEAKVHALAGATDKAAWWTHQFAALPAEVGPRQVLHLRCDRREIQISIDPVGRPLSQRGYRLDPGQALLRWAGLQAGMAVWDPMCGSGTLSIEAALWGQSLASDDFACRHWPGLAAQQPAELADAARVQVESGDLDPEAVQRCRANAERAQVLGQLTLQAVELGAWRRDAAAGPGLVVSNLPWGLRLGGRADARRLAERWAAVVRRRVPGWRAAVVIAEPQLLPLLGLVGAESLAVRSGGRSIWLVRGLVPGKSS